eukprot:m.47243 g.47243  ORF g.47243 m.47243 type:complete len:353 (+) comp10470_c1_seq2:174-1232(+)
MDNQENVYHGGVLILVTSELRTVFVIGAVIALLGIVLCTIVISEIVVFRKAAFQTYRILLLLMAMNIIGNAGFSASIISQTDGHLRYNFFNCPTLSNFNLCNALEYGGVMGGLMTELVIVLQANYCLFYKRKELSWSVECMAYFAIAVGTVVFFSVLLGDYDTVAVRGECGHNKTQARLAADQAEEKFSPPVLVFEIIVLIAYIFLFIMRRRQVQVWRLKLEQAEYLDLVQSHADISIVQAHQEDVYEVVNLFERQLAAFAIATTGLVLCFISLNFFGMSANTDDMLYAVGMFIMRNSQGWMQALGYMTTESNNKNFSCSAFRDRIINSRGKKRITFNDVDEVRYAQEDYED